MSIAAMKLALEALELEASGWFDVPAITRDAITTLRAAIEETEKQEPVAWVYPEGLEALKSAKPWVAYGSNGDGPHSDGVQRIPLYLNNDAVAPRVEPRASESGAGFESLPASPNQPEPEPVAWRWKELVNGEVFDRWVVTSCEPPPYAVETQPLYTAPRQWQGLTDEERKSIREWQRIQEELGPVWAPMMLYLYEAIEAKLKEKNT